MLRYSAARCVDPWCLERSLHQQPLSPPALRQPLERAPDGTHCTAIFALSTPRRFTLARQTSDRLLFLHPHSWTAPSAKLGTAAAAEGGREGQTPTSLPLDPLYELFHSQDPAIVMRLVWLCNCACVATRCVLSAQGLPSGQSLTSRHQITRFHDRNSVGTIKQDMARKVQASSA